MTVNQVKEKSAYPSISRPTKNNFNSSSAALINNVFVNKLKKEKKRKENCKNGILSQISLAKEQHAESKKHNKEINILV